MKQSQTHEKNIDDRRNYFRIEDSVLLRYLTVDQSCALANRIPPRFSEDLHYSLMRNLQDIDHENIQTLRSIAESNRDLETYLKAINKKIDILATTLANSLEPIPDQLNQQISLSEGGLSFSSQTELANDSYLALQLTLLPSYVTLVIFAKIINCSSTENGYKIALSFVHLKDNNRQALAKHVIQQQLTKKRQHLAKD